MRGATELYQKRLKKAHVLCSAIVHGIILVEILTFKGSDRDEKVYERSSSGGLRGPVYGS